LEPPALVRTRPPFKGEIFPPTRRSVLDKQLVPHVQDGRAMPAGVVGMERPDVVGVLVYDRHLVPLVTVETVLFRRHVEFTGRAHRRAGLHLELAVLVMSAAVTAPVEREPVRVAGLQGLLRLQR